MRRWSIVLTLICATACSQQPPSAVIGFLEDHLHPNDIGGVGLRVAFTRHGTDWVPALSDPSTPEEIDLSSVPNINAPQTWQSLGHGAVVTEGWASREWYSANGLLRVKSRFSFPNKRVAIFGGWTGESSHAPVIAVIGMPITADSKWHSVPTHGSDLNAIWTEFVKVVPKVPRCGSNGELIIPEQDTTRRDAEVTATIIGPKKDRLIRATLRQDRLGPCDGVQDRSVSDFWFHVSDKGESSILKMPTGDDALTLTPLVFARLNEEEIAVFFCSGYNRDGYILYYDGFHKSSEFFWSYH